MFLAIEPLSIFFFAKKQKRNSNSTWNMIARIFHRKMTQTEMKMELERKKKKTKK